MARVAASVRRKRELAFAIGNLVPATVLGAGLWGLPVRWWPADVVVGAAVLTLAVASGLVFGRPELTERALTVASRVLLATGVLLVSVTALSMAFLAGIHGDFGRGGVTLMLLVTLLVLPYAIVYPLVELWWLGARSPLVAAAPTPSAESNSAA
jgi:hypothetical protein